MGYDVNGSILQRPKAVATRTLSSYRPRARFSLNAGSVHGRGAPARRRPVSTTLLVTNGDITAPATRITGWVSQRPSGACCTYSGGSVRWGGGRLPGSLMVRPTS